MVEGPNAQGACLYLTVTQHARINRKQLLEGSTPGREEALTSPTPWGSEMKGSGPSYGPWIKVSAHLPPVATGVLVRAQREEGGSGVGDLFNMTLNLGGGERDQELGRQTSG